MRRPRAYSLLPQNLRQRFAFGQLIDQLVEPADFLHQWIFYLFHTDAAHHAFDERTIRVNGWRLRIEGFDITFLFELLAQACSGVARQPADDLVNVFFRTILGFRFLDIERIYLGKFHRVNGVLAGWFGLRLLLLRILEVRLHWHR